MCLVSSRTNEHSSAWQFCSRVSEETRNTCLRPMCAEVRCWFPVQEPTCTMTLWFPVLECFFSFLPVRLLCCYATNYQTTYLLHFLVCLGLLLRGLHALLGRGSMASSRILYEREGRFFLLLLIDTASCAHSPSATTATSGMLGEALTKAYTLSTSEMLADFYMVGILTCCFYLSHMF